MSQANPEEQRLALTNALMERLRGSLAKHPDDKKTSAIEDIARQADTTGRTLYRYLEQARDGQPVGLRFGSLVSLANAIDVSLAQLAVDAGLTKGLKFPEPVPEIERQGEHLKLLSRIAGRVGAGPARLEIPDKPLRYAFRSDWFVRRQLNPEHLVIALVAKTGGDSMEPEIKPDSLLIVDRGKNHVGILQWHEHYEGKVFLVKHPNEKGMKVKRVYYNKPFLMLWSDNPMTKPRAEAIDITGHALQSILLGKVVWIGRDEDPGPEPPKSLLLFKEGKGEPGEPG